jgi:predicted PurR-regulated permease PerM
LSPITISFAIILGGSLGGIAGAIMAVPIAMIVKIVILYFYVDRSMLPENSNPGCGSVEVDQG